MQDWNARRIEGDSAAVFSRAVSHPGGEVISMVLIDSESGYPYVAERGVVGAGRDGDVRRRTTPSADIVSRSVRYSDDGAYMYYLRKRGSGDAELWRVPSGGTEENGRRIVAGMDGGAYSISADGRDALVMKRKDRDSVFEVTLVQIPSGLEKSRFGRGRISDFAWHSSGNYVLAVQSGDTVTPQLVALETGEPYRSVPVSQVNKGVNGIYAVSPGGRRVALVAGSSAMPSLLILDWESLDVEGKLGEVESAPGLRSGD